MSKIVELPLRLALREEGEFWNAYFAKQGTMKDAILLGSIRLSLVRAPDRKEQFMALMRGVFADMLKEVTGQRPVWPEPGGRPAPESERSGDE
jgi:hypothetical protein